MFKIQIISTVNNPIGNLPGHNPEELVDLKALTGTPDNLNNSPNHRINKPSFFPFLNEGSLKLGDWYLSDGLQKLLSSLKKLVGPVGSESFKPTDIVLW